MISRNARLEVRKRIVSTALLSIILLTVHAQEAPAPVKGYRAGRKPDAQVPANPVYVRNVRFEGVTKLSAQERNAIAAP